MTAFLFICAALAVLAVWYSLDKLREGVCKMSAVVDALVAEVGELRTVANSTEALLDRLFAIVQGGIDTGDLAKVQTAVDDLKAERAEMVAAVTRNTPADPPPTP